MADLDIAIAGRNYRVACADGEEENLTEAARLVAAEAESLREQFGTRFAALPETRMLLMASLMLGDRFRAHLAEEASAFAEAPLEAPEAPGAPAAPTQTGFFDDPATTARIAELEAALAAAQEAEQAALAALEEAAERIRSLAGEIADGAVEDEDDGEEAFADDDLELDALDEERGEADLASDMPEPAAFEETAEAEAPDVYEDDLSRDDGSDVDGDVPEDRDEDEDPLAPRS
ncbi:cell division protein ZapA [Albimonas sp. CAU 1670]|uniref:cell division protein ZapA n=1 Tax=Albimonas sp. CAU 1670 TaxID=3032599 RepID=UPI0023D9C679|nr:cell division protein ZapA [Albimonas sp. CAU 1670]MDF2232115.1 cell division protein ZapA [Albimonas sp. CAU 1670]